MPLRLPLRLSSTSLAYRHGNCAGLQHVRYCIFSSATNIWLLQPNYSYQHVQVIQMSALCSICIKRKKAEVLLFKRCGAEQVTAAEVSLGSKSFCKVSGARLTCPAQPESHCFDRLLRCGHSFSMPTRQHVGMLTHVRFAAVNARLRRRRLRRRRLEGSLATVNPSTITAQHLCRKLPSRACRVRHRRALSMPGMNSKSRRRDTPEPPLCLRRFPGGSVNKARLQHTYRPV